ncbi:MULTISPECIES: DUF5063 domain-containing protein [Mumia]|uniref:DUF5063 domain-containing protein n=1 Tax=Mumia xiangluensis TaxID=1678900 RepID=A0ABW1QQL5_9ACTN|nr:MULTISPECIES: DUF5063 domain-containing protein [Mumia]
MSGTKDDELEAVANGFAEDVEAVLEGLRSLDGITDPEEIVAGLLVELSRALTIGARMAAMPRLVPPDRYEPDSGPDIDLDDTRVALATILDGFDTYVEVFDPYDDPAAPAAYRISDDVISLTAALAHGMQHARAGRPIEALWWWQFSFFSSWGGETTSALRALQSVIARDRIVGAIPAMSPEEPPLDPL